ncbi:MAG: LysM peptidoglycan-binding domain-containing protein [Nitrososphaerota archaeon]|nr:LysM peptidoglycan-binding domain-containing protein [Nitrososphaerota archaeon]
MLPRALAMVFVAAMLSLAFVSVPIQAHTFTTYSVKPGDYLILIAMKFNVSWQSIAKLNNITSPYIIYPGQVLFIPKSLCAGNHDSDDCYKVVSGDTLYNIGLRFHVNWKVLAAVNSIPPPYLIYPGEMIYIPHAEEGSH